MDNYIPDSIYSICSGKPCDVCSNEMYSNITGSIVHDSQTGKVFCPFGKGNTMNGYINNDQLYLDKMNINLKPGYSSTKWGHVPQADPRSLSKIGLSWRTS